MATLIPSASSCASRMTGGERRLAQRLEAKLDDDYLLWYDVPVGPKALHPDYVGHLTASAWVVNPAKTHVMLTHHRKFNCWLQLGGHVDEGDESLLTAALREA
jgi:8-oxo-dGTP pyrophosphatase MutT (NUDIX family)